MEKQLVLNIVYGNKTYIVDITDKTNYQDFLTKIFFKITNIIEPDKNNLEIFQENILERFSDKFTLTWITKHINEQSWVEIIDMIESNDTIFINNKLNGGFFSTILIILAIFAILAPLLKPVRKMFEIIIVLFGLVGKFFEILINVIEIVPTIFDPPRLINDVLYAITASLTLIFKKIKGDVSNMGNSPEDDNKESGPFGVSNSNRNAFSCIDPTWSTLLLLIICPPLAIIYKLGFGAGFISSIICGVLCVKLYYFPGLLFAILHVLC